MNEDGDTPNVEGVARAGCDEIHATESEEHLVEYLKKQLEESRKERNLFRIAYLTSEAEKKELIHEVKLQSAEIEKLEAERCYEAKLKAKEIENLKIAHSQSEAEKHYEIKLNSAEIDSLKRALDSLNEKVQTSSDEIDRCKIELDSKASRMNEMDHEIKSKSAEIEKLEAKMENEEKLKAVEIENLKIIHSKAEVEWKSQLNEVENDINSKSKEMGYLQIMDAQWKSAMAKLENDIMSKEEEIKSLKRKSEDEAARSKVELDNVNQKLDESRRDIDRYKKQEGEWTTQISLLKKEVEITGDVARGFEKVEKNLRSLLDRPTEMTIRWRFTEISKLTAIKVHSPPNEFAGLTWRIRVFKKDDHLAFFLKANKLGADKWACAVLGDLQLLSQKDDSIVKHHQFETPIVFNEGVTTWGRHESIPFEDLLKGDAVKDDSIIVAAIITVFPSN